MQKVFRQRVTVQPGGKVEIISPELEAGQTVDVVVLHESSAGTAPSWKSSTAVRSTDCSKRPKR